MSFNSKSLLTVLLVFIIATANGASITLPPAPSKPSDGKENVKFDVRSGFTDVVEKVLPSVVNVISTQVIDNKINGSMPGGIIPKVPPGSPLEDFFKEFFDQMERPRRVQSLGSGFIIKNDGKNLLVVTNNHVINEAKSIKILLNDKTALEATVEATDDRTDIAILKVSLESLPESKRKIPVLEWGESDQVMVGQWVVAIGNPFGFGSTVTTGIISCKGRYVPSGSQHDFEYIQHSAQINMGNSGGCLLDTNGRVIGINNAIITNSGGNIGIGFAIPSDIAKFTVEQLIKYGRVRRGALGVRIQHLTDDMAEGLGLKTNGAIIGSVATDGPAAGKLEAGDIILEYDGKKITEPFHLSRMVAETEIGKISTIKLLRKGKEIEVKIKVTEIKDIKDPAFQSKQEIEQIIDDAVSVLGLKLSNIPPQMHDKIRGKTNKNVRGVIITQVDGRSPAAEIGLMRGDIIEEANQQEVTTPQQFVKIVEQAKANKRKNILLLVIRDGEPRYLPLKIEEDKILEESGKKVEQPKDQKNEPSGQQLLDENSKTVPLPKTEEKNLAVKAEEPKSNVVEKDKEIQREEKNKQKEEEKEKTAGDDKRDIPQNTTPVAPEAMNLLEPNKDDSKSKNDKGFLKDILQKLKSFF